MTTESTFLVPAEAVARLAQRRAALALAGIPVFLSVGITAIVVALSGLVIARVVVKIAAVAALATPLAVGLAVVLLIGLAGVWRVTARV